MRLFDKGKSPLDVFESSNHSHEGFGYKPSSPSASLERIPVGVTVLSMM